MKVMKHLRQCLSCLLASIWLLTACDDPASPPGPPAQVEIVSGEEMGVVGSKLAQPLVLRVADASGKPVPGVTGSWAVKEGEASLSAQTFVTDAQGQGQVEITLGNKSGAVVIEGAVPGVASAHFNIQAKPGAPANATKIEETLIGAVGKPVTIGVRVTDQFGNPLSGVEVGWQVTGGGGAVAPSSTTTKEDGTATTTWTLGTGGKNTVTATIAGITPLNFVTDAVTEVGGVIRSNTIWSRANSPFRLTGDVQIAHGATLTVEPGVEIQGNLRTIEVWGNLKALGSSASPIRFDSTLIESQGVTNETSAITLDTIEFDRGRLTFKPNLGMFRLGNSTVRASELVAVGGGPLAMLESSRIEGNTFTGMRQVNLSPSWNVLLERNTFDTGVTAGGAGLVYFGQNQFIGPASGGGDINAGGYSIAFQGNLFRNMGRLRAASGGRGIRIVENRFERSGGISASVNSNTEVFQIANNSFVEQTTPYAVLYDVLEPNLAQKIRVSANSFWSTDRVALALKVGSGGTAQIDASGNFWNTTDDAVIEKMTFDRNDDLKAIGYVDYKPILTAPDPGTPAR